MRILVVEDEYKVANSLKKGLEQESYAVKEKELLGGLVNLERYYCGWQIIFFTASSCSGGSFLRVSPIS